jgi:hypothetical protein
VASAGGAAEGANHTKRPTRETPSSQPTSEFAHPTRQVRDALADFRVTGARLLPVVVPRRVGVDDLVSERLLLGDPAADAGPGRDVVDAYARLVDHLLERVPAAAGPTQ